MIKAKLVGDVQDRFQFGTDKFAVLNVHRPSGVIDVIYVRDPFELMEVGSRMKIEGEVVTRKYSRDTRKIWFVEPTNSQKAEGEGQVNYLTGWATLTDEPKLRQTPLGKTIAELAFNSAENRCYLYAIAFGDYAKQVAATFKKGDKVKIIKGRLQSRIYHQDTNPEMINEMLLAEIQKI